ncbi:hypothetical protein F5882DRAFT_458187 [Hyaloscypha sp. PMI_1271]|nr:hypothetical protein F5882DRAFT_458187 [Hyaloscypha sp. PMI_1271]
MNANACEVAKAEGEMGRGESDVFGIKAEGRQPMMGPDRGVPSQLRSRADDQALLIATLLANRFHSNPIPQLFFHLMRWNLWIVEAWLVQRLLASSTFHRAVRRVHKKMHEVRQGEKLYDPSEFGGTQIDKPAGTDMRKFIRYYMDELKEQFRGTRKK